MRKLKYLRLFAVFLTVFLVFNQTVFLLPLNAEMNPGNLSGNYSFAEEGAVLSWNFSDDCHYGYKIIRSSASTPSYPEHYESYEQRECSASTLVYPQAAGTNYYYRVCLLSDASYTQCLSQTNILEIEAPHTNAIVIISNPINGVIISVPITVEVSVDSNITIDEVQLHWSGTNMGYQVMSLSSSNIYTYYWDSSTWSDGNYSLIASAYSNGSLLAESETITVTVDNSVSSDGDGGTTDETVSFISPQAEAQLSGETEIKVNINSGNYLIEDVYLHEDNRKISVRQMTLDSSTGNYICNWDTVGAENGDYNLYIRVDWNHTSKEDYFSAPISVSVFNEELPEVPETDTEDDDPIDTINPVNASVNFLDKPAFINGPITLSAQANFDISAMAFSVTGPKNKIYSGIAKGANAFYFKWDVIGGAFPFGSYILKASALLNETEYSDTLNVLYSEENYDNETDTVIVPEPLEITFNEAFQPPISGEQRISVSLDKDAEKVEFMVEGPVNKKYEGIKVSARDFYFIWNTGSGAFPDGYYKVTAGAINAGAIESKNFFSIEIKNNIYSETTIEEKTGENEPLTISILEQINPPIFNNFTITAVTSQSVDTVSFHILGPVEKIFSGIKKDENNYYFIWPTAEFINGFYKLNIVAKKGAAIASKSLSLEIKNQTAENIEFAAEEEAVAGGQLLEECVNNGIKIVEECKQFMLLLPECREKGIKNKMECDVFLSLPSECRERNLNREECDNYLSLPLECRVGNITAPAECENYMFQKAMPLQCRIAGAKTQEECAKIIVLKSLPEKCLEAGISAADECVTLINSGSAATAAAIEKVVDPQTGEEAEIPEKCREIGVLNTEQCRAYLEEKYLPLECRENEIYNLSECDKMMFAKYGPNECREAGISEREECESYMFNKYSQQIICGDNESWQCNNYIKDRHLGNIVVKQAQFAELKEKADLNKGEAINAKKLKDSLVRAKSMVPIKEDEVNFKFIATKGKLVLKDKDDLIQTSPLALMIDSDGDGLPDDIEKRSGTDPNNTDTDFDGYSDYMEIKNGYNPLGEGKYDKSLMAPIEKAILENMPLEHPKTEGKTDDKYQVNEIINNANQEESRPGYVFSGQAESNSVLTLYIYSDLPVVTTVRTNEFGNWEYEFTKSLIEGEHEVYIVLNDNTGRVISKSNPLNFFIKEARAVTLEDFLAAVAVEKAPRTESMISFYIIIAALVIIVGVFMFIILLNIYKTRQRA